MACFQPDAPLEKFWTSSVHSLVAGPSRWLRNAVHYAGEVLGWPVSLPSLRVLSIECKLQRAMKLEPAKLRMLCRLQQSVEARTAATLSTWCASGCTASWTA
eukprot:6365865-Amphidinium_carterae.1